MAVFRGVLDSNAGRDLLTLLGLLAAEHPDPVVIADVFGQLWEELMAESENLLPDAWQSYLVGRILDDENVFSLGAERGETRPAVVEQVRRDLHTLRELFAVDAEVLLEAVESLPGLAEVWVSWRDSSSKVGDSPRSTLAMRFAAASDWSSLAGTLADHYSLHGAGPFGRYRAFRWEGGRLRAVPHPDPVHLSDLIGYEREREPLLKNTERLLARLPSHNVLLYGLPGTGKSSTVKAVLNEYADRGLRLAELSKRDLKDLPRVLKALRSRGLSFLLFVDDLSFEEDEIEYKSLKALLEGSVEEPPANVKVYATSNRRNLIRERFSERVEGGADDVHGRDTMQEKLSLSARFGLRLTFPSPDQKRYLEIVLGLARGRGLRVPAEILEERALIWDRWHAGRSGRTARQFIDELEAELFSQP
jgi:hypothetical protein